MLINYDYFKTLMIAIFLSFFTLLASDFCTVINYSGASPKKSISNSIPPDNQTAQHYDLDYPKLLEIFKNRKSDIPVKWKQIDLNQNNKGEFYVNKKTGFEATAFISDHKIVILIRGMSLDDSNAKNIFSEDKDGCSAQSIFFGNLGVPILGKIPEQFNDAKNFYLLVKKHFPNKKIILVGKSLGGSLAELLGAVYKEETYTFASPGMRYAISLLPNNLRTKVIQNSKNDFDYIKSYCNINDPCGGYGEHIGLSYVYPPIKVENAPFYDVHGNIHHFASEKALNMMTPLPEEWKYKHTAALVYYDNRFKEDIKPVSLHEILKLWFRVKEKDLLEALELTSKIFKKQEHKQEDKKEVVSNYKSDS